MKDMREALFNALDTDIFQTEQKLEGLREARETLKRINNKDLQDTAFLVQWFNGRDQSKGQWG